MEDLNLMIKEYNRIKALIEKGGHDTSYTSEMMCPYCGTESSDSWEYYDNDGTRTCYECENEYSYQRHVIAEYKTYKQGPDTFIEEANPLKLNTEEANDA